MNKKWNNLFIYSKYTTTKIEINFLPRKVGLGFNGTFCKGSKLLLKPLFKDIRKRNNQQDLLFNKNDTIMDSSSDGMSRFAMLGKKPKK